MSRRARWITPGALLAGTVTCILALTGLAQAQPQATPPAAIGGAVGDLRPRGAGAPDEDTVSVRRHYGSRVRIGGSVAVERDERVDDAVAVLGSVTVRGEVTGSAVAIGGDVFVEDGALVEGAVVAVGGRIVTAPTARVSGRAEQVAIDFPEIVRIGPDSPDAIVRVLPDRSRVVGALAALTVFRLASLLLVGLGVLILFRTTALRVADRAAGSPIESLIIGLALVALALPAVLATCFALAVSVVGLPLIPVVMLIACGVWLVGFCGATVGIGRGMLRLVGIGDASPLVAFVLGGLPFAALTIGSRVMWWSKSGSGGVVLAVAIAGLVFEGLLWSVGAGAFVLSRLRRSPTQTARPVGSQPPPAPAQPIQL